MDTLALHEKKYPNLSLQGDDRNFYLTRVLLTRRRRGSLEQPVEKLQFVVTIAQLANPN